MGIRIYSNSFSNPEYYSYSYSLKVDLTNNIRIRIRVKISIRDNTDSEPGFYSSHYDCLVSLRNVFQNLQPSGKSFSILRI